MQYPARQLLPKDFPALLSQIPDAPKKLYIRGVMPSPELKYLCVVGSRACTPYGRRMCATLVAGLTKYPVAIVSGLALGMDGEALKAALDVGLPALAVLPSSVDDESMYPVSNRPLGKRILALGGGLISETEGPYKAMLHDFPKRDRIMAALSHATLIVSPRAWRSTTTARSWACRTSLAARAAWALTDSCVRAPPWCVTAKIF
jgi:DNA processing protein